MIHHGDSLDVLKTLDDESVDLLCTDPPYGIGFMGKEWDTFRPEYINESLSRTPKKRNDGRKAPMMNAAAYAGVYDNSLQGRKGFQKFIYEHSKEWLRVLKPGAFVFLTMTPRQDCLSRVMIAMEDAGFNMGFTSMYWTFASGFPKAMNIGKMVDKRNGKHEGWPDLAAYIDTRIHDSNSVAGEKLGVSGTLIGYWRKGERVPGLNLYRAAQTLYGLDGRFDELIERGEAERKVLDSKKQTVGGNGVYGEYAHQVDITTPETTAAKALDGSYGGFQPKPAVEVIIVAMKPLSEKTYVDQALKNGKGVTWLDDCRVPTQDYRAGGADVSDTRDIYGTYKPLNARVYDGGRFPANLLVEGDVLSDHSRFFSLDAWAQTLPFLAVPKASKSEKNKGLENRTTETVSDGREKTANNAFQRGATERLNIHPTVKPLKLMSYLLTLGSRPGDTVLDPFLGSGTTAIAAKELGREFIGIEREAEYVEIAVARLAAVNPTLI